MRSIYLTSLTTHGFYQHQNIYVRESDGSCILHVAGVDPYVRRPEGPEHMEGLALATARVRRTEKKASGDQNQHGRT